MSREKGRVVLKNACFTGKRLDTGSAGAMRRPEAMAPSFAKATEGRQGKQDRVFS
jgi:hypothetical protein